MINLKVGRYRNRLTGIARAGTFPFSHSHKLINRLQRIISGFFSKSNQHFASAYLRPRQVATLTGRLLSGEPETIRFRFWEATRGLQLQVCCDSVEQCVFRTELGVEKGSRRWRGGQAKCPAGTKKVSFCFDFLKWIHECTKFAVTVKLEAFGCCKAWHLLGCFIFHLFFHISVISDSSNKLTIKGI